MIRPAAGVEPTTLEARQGTVYDPTNNPNPTTAVEVESLIVLASLYIIGMSQRRSRSSRVTDSDIPRVYDF